jgi:hypothetical protein
VGDLAFTPVVKRICRQCGHKLTPNGRLRKVIANPLPGILSRLAERASRQPQHHDLGLMPETLCHSASQLVMPYLVHRNFRKDLGSTAVSSRQVSNCSRQRRTQLLTARMIAYHSSMRSGRRASHRTQNDPPVVEASNQLRGQRDAMAARGHWQDFQAEAEKSRSPLHGENAGLVADEDHRTWYRELFAPRTESGG